MSLAPKVENLNIVCLIPSFVLSNPNKRNLPDQDQATFERSVSGRHSRVIANVCALPEVNLSIQFDANYPDGDRPSIALTSSWLSDDHVKAFILHLQNLWEENKGSAVLFTWISAIEDDLLTVIGVSDVLDLGNSDADYGEILRSFRHILEADSKQSYRDFSVGTHLCPVCYIEGCGSDFFLFCKCQHFFCKACTKNFIQMNIKETTVGYISCLNQECSGDVPVDVIRQVLSVDDFNRWEDLIFKQTLDSMGDTVHCPKCHVVIVDDKGASNSDVIQCPSCDFAFCVNCGAAFHPATSCVTMQNKIDELRKLTEELGLDFDDVVASEDIDVASVSTNEMRKKNAHFILKEKQRKIRQLKEEIMCKSKITEISKQCPNPSCRIPIEKNFGCNKVMCTRCFTAMCYVCGKRITGYDHFGSCPLFVGGDGQVMAHVARLPDREHVQEYLELQANLEADPELQRFVKRCVRCGQVNLKMNNNNHIRCWSCRQNWCYKCNKAFDSMKSHFGLLKDRCPQHSND